MKKLFYILAFISLNAISQNKYITKTGTVNFEASVPSFEEVKASNNAVTAIINTENGEFAALVLVKGFRFKNALMEEHFNENYAESSTHPKATFKGSVEGFKMGAYASETEVVAVGKMTIHGVEKDVKIPGTLKKDGDTYHINAKFNVKPEDYKIEIPNTVRNNIAKEMAVTIDAKLGPLTK